METWLQSLVHDTVQCWGCPVFDRLFQVISSAAAAAYNKLALLALLIMALLIAFHVLRAVFDNFGMLDIFKGGEAKVKDYTFQTYFKPVLINGLVVVALLGLGAWLPRFVTSVTFEPITDIALVYTTSVLQTNQTEVSEKVTYVPKQMPDDGFYRPQLRDKIIQLMKTTITQFQNMMKLGIAVMDKAFSWSALLGVGILLKHIMMFIMGFYLVYGFFRIFIKFCFYFVDVILAMTFFAFFLPLSLVFMIFKNSDTAGWIKNLGNAMSPSFYKNVITAIVSLGAAVITYSVIIVLIAKFFAVQSGDGAELARQILSGDIYSSSLSDDNLAMMTLSGCLVLMYIVTFISNKVPDITKEIMSAFGVSEEHKVGDEMGENAIKIMDEGVKTAKQVGKVVVDAALGKPSAPAGGASKP